MNNWLDLQPLVTFALGIAGFLLTTGWVSASWLNRKFSDTNTLIDYKIEKLEKAIVSKMDYHEKHDDERFSEIRTTAENRFNEVKNDIWDIRVRNAALDNIILPRKSKDISDVK